MIYAYDLIISQSHLEEGMKPRESEESCYIWRFKSIIQTNALRERFKTGYMIYNLDLWYNPRLLKDYENFDGYKIRIDNHGYFEFHYVPDKEYLNLFQLLHGDDIGYIFDIEKYFSECG